MGAAWLMACAGVDDGAATGTSTGAATHGEGTTAAATGSAPDGTGGTASADAGATAGVDGGDASTGEPSPPEPSRGSG